jgi:inward rectifier potassium channel
MLIVLEMLTQYAHSSPGVVNSKIDYYFNLSLQTLATIGYGVLYPGDTCSNWISVAESFVGLLMLSFMTGVAFVKFARPQSNLVFSKIYTVSERENGELEMRFRVLNGTRRTVLVKGEILEAAFKLILMRVEVSLFMYHHIVLLINSISKRKTETKYFATMI